MAETLWWESFPRNSRRTLQTYVGGCERSLARNGSKGVPGDVALHKAAVAVAFDLSYRRLTDDQRRAYRLLSRRPGTCFDPRTAASLLACDIAEARRVLDRLVRVHPLQEPAAGLYQSHDLVRDHAGAQTGGQVDPGDS